MKRYLHLPIGIIFSLLLGFKIQAQQADMDTLFNRLYNQYYNGFTDGSTIEDVITWYNSQNPDGTWTDIANSNSTYMNIVGGYCPDDHLNRTNAMIVAYINKNISGNTFYQSELMLAKIKLALNQNLSHIQPTTFSNDGFYQAYINAIPKYARSLILMKNALTSTEYQTYSDHMSDVMKVKGIRITGSGLNFIGEANSTLYQGIASNNAALIKEGIDSIAGDIRIKSLDNAILDTAGEGIKSDDSWNEHGIQIYSGGYGLEALGIISSDILLVKGTSFYSAFTTERIQLFSNLILGGNRWLSYKKYSDLGTVGRYISRSGDATNSLPSASISSLIKIDPANTASYQDWINHTNGGISTLTGNKHFWKSDIMIQRGATYYLSVRIPSIRRISSEYMNNENLKYKNMLPLGFTQIYNSGNEYFGIYPLWDWSRLPGMTCEKKEIVTVGGPNDTPFGTNTYGGGVSSSGGTVGFMAYKSTYNGISANKSYFFIGDAMFCLGSGITGNTPNGIITSVNQTFLNGTITVNNGSTQSFTTPSTDYTNLAWVHHDNVGYIFPNGGTVSVQNMQQSSSTGTWSNIGSGSDKISPANVFSVWLNHGTTPNNATYQYIVAPSLTLTQFQTYASNPGFVVVQNDGNIQAIRNTIKNVDAIVFYTIGNPVNMGDGLTVQSDKPALVLIEKNATGYNVTVSDPLYNPSNTAITVTINGQKITIPLKVTEDYLGQSQSLQVNLCSSSTMPVAKITAAGSVSVCQGDSVVMNANSGTNLTYQWYTGTTMITGATSASYKAKASGSYSVNVTNTLGCTSTSNIITVIVNALPTAPTVTTPLTYCQNATALALTAAGTSLKWYTTATGGTGLLTAPVPTTTIAGTTNYYVSQTTTGCEGPRSTIAVTVNALPAVPSVTSPVTYCQNANATVLTATGAGLKWYTLVSGGTGSTTAPIPSTSTVGTTNYYVSQTTTGCEGPRAAIAVTVNALPALPTVTSPVTYCQNANATVLTATGAGLKWYTLATGGTGSTTAPIPSTSTVGTTNYYVSQTTTGCEGSRAVITVAVSAIPSSIISTSGPTTFCQGASVVLSIPSVSGQTYQWYSGNTAISGQTAASCSVSVSGSYFVTVTNSSSCSSTSSIMTVSVDSPPTVSDAGPNQIIGLTATTLAGNTPANGTGTWSLISGTGIFTNPSSPTTAISGLSPGINQLQWTIRNGSCPPSSSTVTITVGSAPAKESITGPTTVTVGETGVTYSIPSNHFFPTSKYWILPAGAFISSANADSSKIVVTFGSLGGIVSVTETNSYGSTTDVLYVSMQITTGVVQGTTTQIRVSPNPFNVNTEVLVQSISTEQMEVTIYNALGALCYSSSSYYTNQAFVIGEELKSSGAYIVHLSLGSDVQVIKLIKID